MSLIPEPQPDPSEPSTVSVGPFVERLPVSHQLTIGADLLVVGSHGHGRFSGMLMGSVSTHCVEHASCPVVVVRGEARVAAAGDR